MLKDAFTVIFARGFIRVAQLIAFILLARFLTPAEFGYFGIVTSAIPLAAMLGSLGLRQSFAYEIGGGRFEAGDAVATMLLIWPLLTIVSSAGVWYAMEKDVGGVSANGLAAIIALGVGGAMFIKMVQGVFLGTGNIGRFSLTETLPRVTLTLALVGFALLDLIALDTALWTFAVSFAIVVPIALMSAIKSSSGFSPRFGSLPQMISYGIAFSLNLSMIILNLRVGMFLLGYFSGPEQAGYYFVATRINEIFLEAATALGLVVFSRMLSAGEPTEMLQRNIRISCWMFWSFMIGGVAVALLGPRLLVTLAGSEYESSAPLLQIMAFALAPSAAAKIIYPSIAGQGKPWFGTVAVVSAVVGNAALSYLLIGTLGARGAAFAFVTAQYLLIAIYIGVLRLRFGIPLRDFFLPRVSDARKLVMRMIQSISRTKIRKRL